MHLNINIYYLYTYTYNVYIIYLSVTIFSVCCSTQSISRGLSRSRPSDCVLLLLLYIHGWRYVLLLLYRTIVRPGERPVLRAIMPSGPNSFGRNPPHTRPAGRLKRAADLLPRDCDDAAPRAIIAADSHAYVIIIIIIIDG